MGEIDVDYIHKTPGLIQLRWLDMDRDTKSFLAKLSPELITSFLLQSIELILFLLLEELLLIKPCLNETNSIRWPRVHDLQHVCHSSQDLDSFLFLPELLELLLDLRQCNRIFTFLTSFRTFVATRT